MCYYFFGTLYFEYGLRKEKDEHNMAICFSGFVDS